MPYLLVDKGAKYYLTDHVSIDQMIEAEIVLDAWPKMLREKFSKDKELLAYSRSA